MKKLLFGVVIFLAVTAILFAMTESRSNAQSSSPNNELTSKVDRILTGQKEILDDMAYIKEELRIIKVRVTQAQ